MTLADLDDALPPRKAIPKAWKLAAWTRDGGKCCECGADVPQAGQGVEYDHRLPLWLTGAHSVENIAPICPDPCHKAKSRREAPIRAKVNRIRKERAGVKRAKRAIPNRGFEKPKSKRPWPKQSLGWGRKKAARAGTRVAAGQAPGGNK